MCRVGEKISRVSGKSKRLYLTRSHAATNVAHRVGVIAPVANGITGLQFCAPTIWQFCCRNGRLHPEMRPAGHVFWWSVIRNGS